MKLEPWPAWAEQALQGLVFWIGHRQSLYPHWPLGESALVAETCNLICAHLESGDVLLCERAYAKLLPPHAFDEPTDGVCKIRRADRADLVVVSGLSHRDADRATSLVNELRFVIEVKRARAGTTQINRDLWRLAAVKRASPSVRALLFVVSESGRPERFVNASGKAILGAHSIPNTDAHYRVRRACKAARAFSSTASAHFACIVEVFDGVAKPTRPTLNKTVIGGTV